MTYVARYLLLLRYIGKVAVIIHTVDVTNKTESNFVFMPRSSMVGRMGHLSLKNDPGVGNYIVTTQIPNINGGTVMVAD